jgi:hypothetical protein
MTEPTYLTTDVSTVPAELMHACPYCQSYAMKELRTHADRRQLSDNEVELCSIDMLCSVCSRTSTRRTIKSDIGIYDEVVRGGTRYE